MADIADSHCVRHPTLRICSPKLHCGFTLVELLIVAIILAVLMAIVVPQFGSLTSDAQESALRSNLSGIRSAIDLYFQQHGHYPGSVAANGASCPAGGTAGNGNANNAIQRAQAFASQLTMYTNSAGEACSTTDATFRFGPYLSVAQMGESGIPMNPLTADNPVEVIVTGDLLINSTVTTGGWKYDAVTGKFIADHSDFDHF